jgi:two-component system chemotaxis response regulator CheY
VAARVLIVEDSPAMRQLLRLALRHYHGVEIIEAQDGVEALKALATERYDVIFADLNMPILDGMKLIRRVRDDPTHAGTRIVVVTNEDSPDVERQARSLGADHFVKKPVNRRAIDKVLKDLFV